MTTYLGRSSGDLDPKQAAHENRILMCLERRGALRESDVKLYTTSTRQVGREIHNRAVKDLIAAGLIRKLSTTRANSFILELTAKLRYSFSPTIEKKSSAALPVITHLGRSRDEIDPKQAAHENRILVCLWKRGTLRENEVKLHTASTRRVGREIHKRAVESLVEQGLIRRLNTSLANSFILELTGKLQNPLLPSLSEGMWRLDRTAEQRGRNVNACSAE